MFNQSKSLNIFLIIILSISFFNLAECSQARAQSTSNWFSTRNIVGISIGIATVGYCVYKWWNMPKENGQQTLQQKKQKFIDALTKEEQLLMNEFFSLLNITHNEWNEYKKLKEKDYIEW